MDSRQLRTLVEKVQFQVARATASDPTAEDKQALTVTWESLVRHLALGPAPDTRDCPRCGKEIMKAATVCGHCWSKVAAVGA